MVSYRGPKRKFQDRKTAKWQSFGSLMFLGHQGPRPRNIPDLGPEMSQTVSKTSSQGAFVFLVDREWLGCAAVWVTRITNPQNPWKRRENRSKKRNSSQGKTTRNFKKTRKEGQGSEGFLRADLRGSLGNFWGSRGNFRGSLGNFRGSPGLL